VGLATAVITVIIPNLDGKEKEKEVDPGAVRRTTEQKS
jgi:hypothetical protein